MNIQIQESLKDICKRVSFDRVERKLNSHDIAAMPGLIKPILGNTLADAVVQPQTELELVKLIKWANQFGVPLTPRGKATSGYGGVIPVKKGVVVEFNFMKSVLNVDYENMAVTVQPGITWEQLDKLIKKDGFTLRLYPSSYPSATVGGWLAQGGAGSAVMNLGISVKM